MAYIGRRQGRTAACPHCKAEKCGTTNRPKGYKADQGDHYTHET